MARVPLTASATRAGQAGGGQVGGGHVGDGQGGGQGAADQAGGVDRYGQPIAGSGGGIGEAAAGDPNAQLAASAAAGAAGDRYGTAASPYGSNGSSQDAQNGAQAGQNERTGSPEAVARNDATGGGNGTARGQGSSGAQSGSPSQSSAGQMTSGGQSGSSAGSGSASSSASGTPPSMNVQMGGGPASQQAPQGKQHRSLAHARGRDWGLPEGGSAQSAATRPILVYCFKDRLIIPSERANQPPTEVKVGEKAQDSMDEFVHGVWQHMKAWGTPGKGLYWRPTLLMDIQPGAADRYAEVKALLEDSGLDVHERPAPATATQPAPKKNFRR